MWRKKKKTYKESCSAAADTLFPESVLHAGTPSLVPCCALPMPSIWNALSLRTHFLKSSSSPKSHFKCHLFWELLLISTHQFFTPPTEDSP